MTIGRIRATRPSGDVSPGRNRADIVARRFLLSCTSLALGGPVIGAMVTMLGVTGIVIWTKERSGRLLHPGIERPDFIRGPFPAMGAR